MLSYRTAYLKAHYPREYISALMTSVLGSADKLAEYISECARIGIRVLPPHVNDSARDFHVDGKHIRYGLLALKNLGRQFVDALIDERERNGRFASFDDFIARMEDAHMNKKQLEMLIKSGALDGLGAARSQMLAVHDTLLESRLAGRQRLEGQLDLFALAAGSGSERQIPRISLPEIPEFPPRELLRLEKESSGLYFSGHLLDGYSRHLERLRPDSIASIKASFAEEEDTDDAERTEGAYRDKQAVILAGIVTKRQNKATRGGEPMAFLTLEDRSGEMEILVFPKVLAEYSPYLTVNAAVALRGTVSAREEEDVKVLMRDMQPLLENDSAVEIPPEEPETQKKQPDPPRPSSEKQNPAIPPNAPSRLFLKVSSMQDPAFVRAENFLSIFPGTFAVVFYDVSAGKYLRADHLSTVPNPFVLRELKEILGEDSVILR